MPHVSLNSIELLDRLGWKYDRKQLTTKVKEKLDALCFDFGLELDDVDVEEDGSVIYKFDVGANRYDLLCLEGISRSLRMYLGDIGIPDYRLFQAKNPIQMVVKDSALSVRPVVVCGVLRNISFDERSVKRFMELQDKLHLNICRHRRLASIGTHDLNTVKAPFTYGAERPEDIRFVPLGLEKEMNATELIDHVSGHLPHLKPYTPLLTAHELYPVVRDHNGVVLSLPPLLNGEHSKITVNTKDILVEVTAIDRTKASITLNVVLAMFSEYCEVPYQAESVQVVEPKAEHPRITPDFSKTVFETTVDYLNAMIGTELDGPAICKLLHRMGLCASSEEDKPAAAAGTAAQSPEGKKSSQKVIVRAPCTRSDILHPCDIAEDVAIAYGYNNLPQKPPETHSVASQQPLNQLCDQLRKSMVSIGYKELLTFSLVAEENNLEIFGNEKRVVRLANPKSLDFQVARTSLAGCILKGLCGNQSNPVPLRVFEVADVVLTDDNKEFPYQNETKTHNERRLCIGYMDRSAHFEVVHGILDRIMAWLDVPVQSSASPNGYRLEDLVHPAFFKGQAANVYVGDKNNKLLVARIGSLHPNTLKHFKLALPVTILEIKVGLFL